MISGPNRRISEPARSVNFLYDWLGFGTEPDTSVVNQKMLHGDGALAAVLGFESPVTSGRSVVAVTAVDDKDMGRVLDVLQDEGIARNMHGSAVFVRGDRVDSILAGNTYAMGELPFWLSIWYPLTQRPILLAILVLASGVLGLYALWRGIKRIGRSTGGRE